MTAAGANKPRRGRPARTAGEPMTVRRTVRMTEREAASLDALAAAHDLDASETLRRLAFQIPLDD